MGESCWDNTVVKKKKKIFIVVIRVDFWQAWQPAYCLQNTLVLSDCTGCANILFPDGLDTLFNISRVISVKGFIFVIQKLIVLEQGYLGF